MEEKCSINISMNYIQLDENQIPFDRNWNSIAISLSGGADSSLLSFILCDYISKNNLNILVHIISHIRMWKTRPWQEHDSLRVYQWLKDQFPTISFIRHTNFIAPDIEYGNTGPIVCDEYGKIVSGDNAQIRAFSEYICYKENIEAYYNAVTRNPKNIDLGGMRERDIDPNESNKHLILMQHMGKWAVHPFRFIEKSWIVKKYKDLGLLELFDITRSCEGEFFNIDYKNYIVGQDVPTCGQCFWCKEREWAIEQNK